MKGAGLCGTVGGPAGRWSGVTVARPESSFQPSSSPAGHRSPVFATTRWTLVLAAGAEGATPAQREALEQLCRIYWYPLYAYVRRRGYDAHGAEDLTQSFFARLLVRNDLQGMTREGGRFRSYLLTALNHHLANEHERQTARKRGGGQVLISLDHREGEERYGLEPSHEVSPDRLFERQWALALLEAALGRLARDQEASGRGESFACLRPFLSREPEPGEYATVAARLGVSPGALAVQVHRLRERYRQFVRTSVAETVDNPFEVEAEMRHLLAAVSGS